MRKKSVKKNTKADKKRILYESNLTRKPAMHWPIRFYFLVKFMYCYYIKIIIKEILYAVIASMLTIDKFFEGDHKEIMTNCLSVSQTAWNNK